MDLRQIGAVYDRRAATYDRTVGRGERWLVGDLREAFGAALRGRVLEVAVGSGLNLPYYPATVTEAVGVDLSHGMLRQVRSAGRADVAGGVHLARMDAQRLAFRDASFDTVALSLALCTVPDPVAALREVARVCRPDGRVVLLEHVRSSVAPVAWLQQGLSPLQERLIGCQLARETVATLVAEGFSVVSERQRRLGVFRLVVARPPTASG